MSKKSYHSKNFYLQKTTGIVDGINLERNLYLTTQLTGLGIPIVVAVNMMDVVSKSGDRIYIDRLLKELGCPVMEISALKGSGITEVVEKAVGIAKNKEFNAVVLNIIEYLLRYF